MPKKFDEWVAVDLDGTLAHWDKWDERNPTFIGAPILPMLELVKAMLKIGLDVRIFTTRLRTPEAPLHIIAIQDWCKNHIGQILPIEAEKLPGMIALIDDRAVSVERNTGKIAGFSNSHTQFLYNITARMQEKAPEVVTDTSGKQYTLHPLDQGHGQEIPPPGFVAPVPPVVDLWGDPFPIPVPSVHEILRKAADTFESRNKEYGNSYKRLGTILMALFPDGIPSQDAEGWNRVGILFAIAGKLNRYVCNPRGHIDSAHDASVYAAMLEELTTAAHGGGPK